MGSHPKDGSSIEESEAEKVQLSTIHTAVQLPAEPEKLQTSTILTCSVTGRPRTKGSLNQHFQEQVADSKRWRRLVARRLREAQIERYGRLLALAEPVEVRLLFTFPRTESVNGGVVPAHDTPWPTPITVGDLDKLIRNIGDAMLRPMNRGQMPLTSALLADDSLIVGIRAWKFWARDGEQPGVLIRVLPVTDVEAEREAALSWISE